MKNSILYNKGFSEINAFHYLNIIPLHDFYDLHVSTIAIDGFGVSPLRTRLFVSKTSEISF